MPTIQLPAADQQRLEALAAMAGATVEQALSYVLRDGFLETERMVRAVTRARAQALPGVAHADAMTRLDDLLNQHGAARQAA